MTRIFVLCTGQDDNIGDVVLRRSLLHRLRPFGDLHIHLGPASTGFKDSLELGDTDVVYEAMGEWRSALRSSVFREPTWFVDKPGELQMRRRTLLQQARLALLIAVIRLRGGKVLRLGIGQRRAQPVYAALFGLLFRLSTLVAWRDTASARSFGFGSVMPDWGFGDIGPSSEQSSALDKTKTKLVVSYRSDRPMISVALLAGIQTYAQENNLDIVTVSQVKRDGPRGVELAEKLGARDFPWLDTSSHIVQELALRRLYSEAALVVSDRLHVLIVAMTESAIPICLVDYPENKISRHFEAIGVDEVSQDVSGLREQDIIDRLARQVSRRAEVDDALERARIRIIDVVRSIDPQTSR